MQPLKTVIMEASADRIELVPDVVKVDAEAREEGGLRGFRSIPITRLRVAEGLPTA